MGKKKDDFTWLSERINYLTKNETFELINSGGKDYFPTFRVGAWTILKEMILAYYAPNYIRIIRNQPHIKKINYLDLFAGSGIVRLDELSKNYLGSPLVVTKAIPNTFDRYFFFEKDRAKTEQLEELLSAQNCFVHQGDCNELIDYILEQIKSPENHSLVFIDPFAMEIKFETINKFAQVGCDLMITVATQEIYRAMRKWFENPTENSQQLDSFFGDQDWRISLADIKSDEEIFSYYANRIVQFAFKKTPMSTKIEKQIGGQHYFVLFTSTGGQGVTPKWFKIIKSFNERIKNLSGEEITNYLKHYVEGNGASLSRFIQ